MGPPGRGDPRGRPFSARGHRALAPDARAAHQHGVVGPAATAAADRLMLARIAHELYWIGRRVSRAEHTARMLDGVFHADLQGRAEDPSEVRLSWDALLAIMGAA